MMFTFPNLRRRYGHRVPGLLGFGALAYAAVRIAATLVSDVLNGEAKTDWVPLYTVGTLVRTGDGDRLFDRAAQAGVQLRLFGVTGDLNLFQQPPSVAYIVAPLTLLSFKASYFVWLGVNLAFAAALLFVMWRFLEPMPRSQRRYFVLASALSAPVAFLLFMGQTDLLVLSAILGSGGMLSRDRPGWAGALLAGSLLKPHFTVSVVVLLAVRREWKALGAFAVTGAVVLGFPFLIEGPRLVSTYSALVSEFLSASPDVQVNQEEMVNLRGTMTSVYGGSALVWAIPLAATAVVAVALAVRQWLDEGGIGAQTWAVALVLPLICAPHVHFHSLVFLLAGATLYARSMAVHGREVKITYVVVAHLVVIVLWGLSGEVIGLLSIAVIAFFFACLYAWPGARDRRQRDASHAGRRLGSMGTGSTSTQPATD